MENNNKTNKLNTAISKISWTSATLPKEVADKMNLVISGVAEVDTTVLQFLAKNKPLDSKLANLVLEWSTAQIPSIRNDCVTRVSKRIAAINASRTQTSVPDTIQLVYGLINHKLKVDGLNKLDPLNGHGQMIHTHLLEQAAKKLGNLILVAWAYIQDNPQDKSLQENLLAFELELRMTSDQHVILSEVHRQTVSGGN